MYNKVFSKVTGRVYLQRPSGFVDFNGHPFRGAILQLLDLEDEVLFFCIGDGGYIKVTDIADSNLRVVPVYVRERFTGRECKMTERTFDRGRQLDRQEFALIPKGVQVESSNQNGQVSDMISFDELTKGRKGMQKGEIVIIGSGEGHSKLIHPANFDNTVFVSFEADVIDWASKRNIIQGGTIEGQVGKLKEELQELVDALDDNDQYEVVDAIGDISVVLTILAAMRGTTLSKCQFQAYNEIKDRKGRMINGAFVKEANLPENQ